MAGHRSDRDRRSGHPDPRRPQRLRAGGSGRRARECRLHEPRASASADRRTPTRSTDSGALSITRWPAPASRPQVTGAAELAHQRRRAGRSRLQRRLQERGPARQPLRAGPVPDVGPQSAGRRSRLDFASRHTSASSQRRRGAGAPERIGRCGGRRSWIHRQFHGQRQVQEERHPAPDGHINITMRRTESDGVHVFQLKSALAVGACTRSRVGQGDGRGEGLNPGCARTRPPPSCLPATRPFESPSTTTASPGAFVDAIAITALKDGALWFSSHWSGTSSLDQTIAGGDFQVR